MKYNITCGDFTVGIAAESAMQGQTEVRVRMREFVSSEDGDVLVSRLENLLDPILRHAPKQLNPSCIDHLVAIIRPDKTATVYINELTLTSSIRVRKNYDKGESILEGDFLDIQTMKIGNIEIPPDAGFMVLLSHRWRKGFYYDLLPLHFPGQPQREYDVERQLGQVWAYLVFQDLFTIDESTWREFFRQRWFPFICLGKPFLKRMIASAKSCSDMDSLLPDIQDEVKKILVNAPGIWRANPYFTSHLPFVEKAIEHYNANDHISACSILYPRIEGIMRSYFNSAGIQGGTSAVNLQRAVAQKDEDRRHGCCYLLPGKFLDYLDEVYFASFVSGTDPDVGRHAVAHGEARAEDYTAKTSVIALLTLYQVALCLSPEVDTSPQAGGGASPPCGSPLGDQCE